MALDYDFGKVHQAICGSPGVGTYSDTIVDRYRVALAELKRVKDAAGIKTDIVSSASAGPFMDPTNTSADIRSQLTAAFECEPGVFRTVAQMHQQFLVDLQAVNNATPAPGAPVTTPTSTTPAAPAGLPANTAQGTLLWAADYTKNSITAAGFLSTNWNNESGFGWPPPIVDAPDKPGEKCIKFALPKGGKRIEVQPTANQNMGKNQEIWYGFWFIVDDAFTRSIDDWHIIAQWHGNDTTSPNQLLGINGGNMLTGNEPQYYFAKGQIKAGVRYNCVSKISSDGAGHQSVWLNDKLVLDNYAAGLNATPLYLKLGIYQRPDAFPASTTYQGQHRLGTGYGAVRPR